MFTEVKRFRNPVRQCFQPKLGYDRKRDSPTEADTPLLQSMETTVV